MSVHLNECQCYEGSCCPWMGECTCQCICDVLRACEERMLNDDIPAAVYHSQKGYQIGYVAGLDAAREAVAALPWQVAVSYGPIDCDHSCEHGPCSCSGVMRPEAWMTGPAETIAVIDALTEDSND